jgi:type II restriction enzyme
VHVDKIKLEGNISSSEDAEVSKIAKELEEGKNGSNYGNEIKSIYDADDSNLTDTSIVIDLYLQDDSGKETFIEMKGPDPNKKEVRAAKEDLLRVVAIQKRKYSTVSDFNSGARIVFGITYNNIAPKQYKNWKVSPLFEDGKGLFVGKDFWNMMGGSGTYQDLMELIPTINNTLFPDIDKKLSAI